jgi:predicted nucleotidyltransferase
MDSLRRVAIDLEIPERTLRRAASEGLLHGERISPRKFHIGLREETYLRRYWAVLRALRAAFRTEPNVRLAVLFGSTATGRDHARSDLDVMVGLRMPAVERLAELTERLSQRVGRDVQLVRLSEAADSPALMLDIIEQGRVLIDREELWPSLQASAATWRRRARRLERSPSQTIEAPALPKQVA